MQIKPRSFNRTGKRWDVGVINTDHRHNRRFQPKRLEKNCQDDTREAEFQGFSDKKDHSYGCHLIGALIGALIMDRACRNLARKISLARKNSLTRKIRLLSSNSGFRIPTASSSLTVLKQEKKYEPCSDISVESSPA